MDESTSKAGLTHGIAVPLFQAGHDRDMDRITLRVLDADLYQHSLHPVQLTEAVLDQLTSCSGVKPHVKKVVEQLLQIKQVVPIQYITRSSLKVRDSTYKFSSAIRRDFVKYVRKKFFSTKYLERVKRFKTQAPGDRAPDAVRACV